MSKKVKVVEDPKRIQELLGLDTGAIIARMNESATDIIVAEKMAILTSARGTFIHYEGSPEYALYSSLANGTGLMSELDSETAAAFKDMMLLTPSVYFYMHENVEFHNHCAMQFLSMLERGMAEAIEKMADNPEASREYLNEQRVLNVVLGMLENDLAEVKANTYSLADTPPKKKRKTSK